MVKKDKLVDDVLKRMKARSDSGIKKFGKTMLEAKKPFLSWIADAQEEAWDTIIYLEKVKTLVKEDEIDMYDEHFKPGGTI